jgi:hypothetical protein
MAKLETQTCTNIIWPGDTSPKDLDLDFREIPIAKRYSMKPFYPQADLTYLEIDGLLAGLLLKEEGAETIIEKPKRNPKPTWVNKVNEKRRRVLRIIDNFGATSIKDLAKRAKVSPATASRIFKECQSRCEVEDWKYPHEHSQEVEEMVDAMIDNPSSRYYSAADFKREIPIPVSKKFVRKRLKAKGYQYKRIKGPFSVKKNNEERYEHPCLQETISMVAQTFGQLEKEIFWLDEVKFPLQSTGQYAWVKEGTKPAYNDRPQNLTLHAICLCDRTNFKAVQFFLDEIKSNDILYFIKTFLNTYVTAPETIILLDNATWHKSEDIRQSEVYQFLWFNAPGVFEANLIENAFSAIKTQFRTRKETESLVDELTMMKRLFVDPENKKRFEGYRKNYLRGLRRMLKCIDDLGPPEKALLKPKQRLLKRTIGRGG